MTDRVVRQGPSDDREGIAGMSLDLAHSERFHKQERKSAVPLSHEKCKMRNETTIQIHKELLILSALMKNMRGNLRSMHVTG